MQYIHTYMYARTFTRAHTHACTHASTQERTHTRKHTHIYDTCIHCAGSVSSLLHAQEDIKISVDESDVDTDAGSSSSTFLSCTATARDHPSGLLKLPTQKSIYSSGSEPAFSVSRSIDIVQLNLVP